MPHAESARATARIWRFFLVAALQGRSRIKVATIGPLLLSKRFYTCLALRLALQHHSFCKGVGYWALRSYSLLYNAGVCQAVSTRLRHIGIRLHSKTYTMYVQARLCTWRSGHNGTLLNFTFYQSSKSVIHKGYIEFGGLYYIAAASSM